MKELEGELSEIVGTQTMKTMHDALAQIVSHLLAVESVDRESIIPKRRSVRLQ